MLQDGALILLVDNAHVSVDLAEDLQPYAALQQHNEDSTLHWFWTRQGCHNQACHWHPAASWHLVKLSSGGECAPVTFLPEVVMFWTSPMRS